jgi:drug/metabolite transporter (DMT)-like permease
VINYGESVALICSFIWATNGLILKTISERVPPTLITAIRCGIATPIFWVLLPFGPPLETLLAVPLYEWALLIGSVFIGILIGDLLYLHAMRHIGISRTMALVGTFPISTLLWEQLLLDSPTTYTFVLGCFLAASGTILMSRQSQQQKDNAEFTHMKRGVILALSAALLWGLSTTMLKPAIANLTSVQANSVRMPFVALGLLLIWRFNRRRNAALQLDKKTAIVLCFTGLMGMALGSFLYIEAVDQIGPAKTATVSAATPVIALIMAVIFLKEALTIRLVLGISLCVTGVILVL